MDVEGDVVGPDTIELGDGPVDMLVPCPKRDARPLADIGAGTQGDGNSLIVRNSRAVGSFAARYHRSRRALRQEW